MVKENLLISPQSVADKRLSNKKARKLSCVIQTVDPSYFGSSLFSQAQMGKHKALNRFNAKRDELDTDVDLHIR